jgi:low affinity Fe/Cu permease
MSKRFSQLANFVAEVSGHPGVFGLAALTIVLWLLTGPLLAFSDTWLLIMNTWTSVVTFLMVFLIQNSQNRDSAAIQVKLDELIRVSTAHNSLVGIEHLTDDELEEIRNECERRAEAEKVGEAEVRRTGEMARKAAERVVAAE